MDIKQGTGVFTAQDQQVGHVDRVVLDPRTKEVTDIVVRKGLILTEDKVVPISLIASATEDRVTLRENAGDLDKLPYFEETHYVGVDERESPWNSPQPGYPPPLYWTPPIGGSPTDYPNYDLLPYIAQVKQNIPEGTVALKDGAKIISADGKHVGDVERVLTGPLVDRATHLVMSQGLMHKNRKLIPTTWVSTVEEGKVHLAVGSDLLDKLQDYKD